MAITLPNPTIFEFYEGTVEENFDFINGENLNKASKALLENQDALLEVLNDFFDNPSFSGTGALSLPVGTTAQRPINALVGAFRFNSDFDNLEVKKASGWSKLDKSIIYAIALGG